MLQNWLGQGEKDEDGKDKVGLGPSRRPVVGLALGGGAARGFAHIGILRALLERCDPLTARSVIKVLSGELRIGLREGHLEAAIASAFDRQLADVQWTGMLTGDLGRKDMPILRDPAPLPAADLIISECTYGGRNHPGVEMLASDLGEVVKRTVARGGKLMIPAFSLGRTQTIVYFLFEKAFQTAQFGYGSAAAYVLFVATLIATIAAVLNAMRACRRGCPRCRRWPRRGRRPRRRRS